MEAKSTDQKTFQLVENGQRLGELIYKNLFFLKAEIKLANSNTYELNPVGIFGTSIAVTKNGTALGNLEMNWLGKIVFSFQDGRKFSLKPKGIFSNKYIFENKNGEKIIELDAKFNWNKFNYSYDITFTEKPTDILLVLLCVYASNYFIASMSGSLAGIA